MRCRSPSLELSVPADDAAEVQHGAEGDPPPLRFGLERHCVARGGGSEKKKKRGARGK